MEVTRSVCAEAVSDIEPVREPDCDPPAVLPVALPPVLPVALPPVLPVALPPAVEPVLEEPLPLLSVPVTSTFLPTSDEKFEALPVKRYVEPLIEELPAVLPAVEPAVPVAEPGEDEDDPPDIDASVRM